MKCWRNACNLGRNSSSLTPSRKENTPLKLTNEMSCICSPVVFLRMRVLPKYAFGRNRDDPSPLLPVNPPGADQAWRSGQLSTVVESKMGAVAWGQWPTLRFPSHRVTGGGHP